MSAATWPPGRLSILVVTYNHARYIRQAIDGVLMQELPDNFEVVVADDGSSDDTRDIIAQMFAAHSEFSVRFLDFSCNRGITRNYERGFAACKGDYVAVLEGDDYWTSPQKLLRQMSFLHAHRECSACATNYFAYELDKDKFSLRWGKSSGFLYLDARSLIEENLIGNFSTCMYRRTALATVPPELFGVRAYDWAINICVGRVGLIGFLEEPMSVYRVHPGGAWNGLASDEKLRLQLADLENYDRLTDQVFHDEFKALARRLRRVRIVTASPWRRWPLRLFRIGVAFVPPVLVSMSRTIVPPAFGIGYRKLKKQFQDGR